jgi:hypothetical protein
MKQKVKALFFYAYWDGSYNERNEFVDECKALGMPFEMIDVETEDGLKASLKYDVKMCPRVLFVRNNRVIGRENGKSAYLKVEDYINK